MINYILTLMKVIVFVFLLYIHYRIFCKTLTIKFLDIILFFTTDGRISRAIKSYLSLTIHYITSDFNMHHFMLNLHHVKQSHTAQNIKNISRECLSTWKFYYANRPLIFVTDSGGNIVNPISMCKEQKHIPYFAHSIQLVIKSSLKKFPLYEIIKTKCRKIVGFFAKSTTSRQKCIEIQLSVSPNETPLQLVQEVDTRWNSMYLILQRLNILRRPLSLILCDNNMSNNLTTKEQKFTEEIVNLLEPIKQVTDIMCGESFPTISLYFPMYVGLNHVFEKDDIKDRTANNIRKQLCNKLKVILLSF